MTQTQAYDTLPAGAKWSSSFGNPGEGGYTEFWRTAEGKRYVVANGKYDAISPFLWTVEQA